MYYTMDLKQHHGLSILYACCYPSYTICINHYKPSPCCSWDPVGNSSAVKNTMTVALVFEGRARLRVKTFGIIIGTKSW